MARNLSQQFYICLDSLTKRIEGKFKLLPNTHIFSLPLRVAGLINGITRHSGSAKPPITDSCRAETLMCATQQIQPATGGVRAPISVEDYYSAI